VKLGFSGEDDLRGDLVFVPMLSGFCNVLVGLMGLPTSDEDDVGGRDGVLLRDDGLDRDELAKRDCGALIGVGSARICRVSVVVLAAGVCGLRIACFSGA
jgi:hypothetical protein